MAQMRIVMYENRDDTWYPVLTDREICNNAKHGKEREATDEDLKPLGLQRYCPTCAEQREKLEQYTVVTRKFVKLPDGSEFDISKIIFVSNVLLPDSGFSVQGLMTTPGHYGVMLSNGATLYFDNELIPRDELVKLWKQET